LAHRLTGGDAGHGRAAGLLMSVGVGAFLAMNVMMLSFVLYSGRGEADRAAGEAWVRWALLLLATPAVALLGAPFLTNGLARLRRGQIDTDALIVLGVAAAYALSARSVLAGGGPLYLDTAMGILLFVTLGRYLEAAARARTTDALAALVSRLPREATRVSTDGREERVPLDVLVVGDRVRVRPGERLPADGVVLEGESSVSEAELTGEPLPVLRGPGASVAACTLNLDGSLLVEVRRTGGTTTVARIVRLVEQARAGRPPLATLVERVARLFVPVVLALAVATYAYWSVRVDSGVALMHALAVLLIACPCALGIATPLASTAAAGRAASAGVLIRSGEVFERLARARRVFFDKTGTLTDGRPALVALHPAASVTADELLAWAAALEQQSEHPLAGAILEAARARGLTLAPVRGFRATPGRGVSARAVDARFDPAAEWRLGRADFVVAAREVEEPGATLVHLSAGARWLGALALRDAPRVSTAPALAALAAGGLALELLSGDRAESVAAFTHTLGASQATPPVALSALAGLTPEDKLQRVLAAARDGEAPVMVGDGINDAPALSGAAVGVTLESGTDLARDAADVTVLGGDLRRLPWLLSFARVTLRTAAFNLFWAFFYNLIGLALAVQGKLHPLFGAVAMIASSLFVVLNSQRLTRWPLPASEP
jgi:heavy metal translocating P-type ATPase